MEEYKVLITTSGIGSRLGELTKYTNKSLIRIGKKPALSYIIESYPVNTKFVLTLGYHGNYVKEFIKLAYPEIDIEFVQIDNYDGVGSSLGYSLLQSKHLLQCPFIIHVGDSIINDNIKIPDHNWLGSCEMYESSEYRTISINNKKIINEKGELNNHLIYIGLAGIYDYEKFWDCLYSEYNSDPNDSTLCDCHAINSMEIAWDVINYNWMDIGNITQLKNTRNKIYDKFEILDKLDESIFIFNDFVIKFFSNTEIIKNRVKRANVLKGLVPDIIESTNNFYKYKKAKGHTFSESVNKNKFKLFLDWASNNLWNKKESIDFNKKCKNFYYHKTLKRIDDYLIQNKDNKNIINGCQIPPINDLISKIDFDYISNGIPSNFHGDFILDNVIENGNNFTLIDWRQDFSGDLEIGDIYYDLAKLNHNLTVNHDIVNKGLYGTDGENYYILTNSTLNECKKILHEFIIKNGYDLNKVEILTALIWINMSPLHDHPFNDFLFNYGKYCLSNIVENTQHEQK